MFNWGYGLSSLAILKFIGSFINFFHWRLFGAVWILQFIGWSTVTSITINNGLLDKIYVAIKSQAYKWLMFVLCFAWVVAVWFYFRLILRTAFFYSALVLLDLVFIKEFEEKFVKKPALLTWLLLMGEVAATQFFIYSVYLFIYGKFHLEAPPLLLYYIIPDLILALLMLIPFCIRCGGYFEKNETKKGEKCKDGQKAVKLDGQGINGSSSSRSSELIIGPIDYRRREMEQFQRRNFRNLHDLENQ